MSQNRTSQNRSWGGRFEGGSSELLKAFNASILFDRELFCEDIEGSVAHASMLESIGILSSDELISIKKGLDQVKSEIESGNFEFDIADEDIHMAVEKRLVELIGDAGKKVHTARSRNDQVALDFRLWTLRKNRLISHLLRELVSTLITLAKTHKTTLLPGMTHLQHAQPISFAYHLLAYASMFVRDHDRFVSSTKRNNISPIGCAALAGTPHKIDREMVAKILGFDGVSTNCLDTVSDRDFALEMLFNASTCIMHMSRLCEELIVWSSSEFGFITISDEYSTGSSIMPNKKNPDVAELIRGKTGRVYGNLMGLLTVMKALPLAYNKDMQEDKEGVFDTVRTIEESLIILNEMIKTMSINSANMLVASKKGHLTATDLADYLVRKSIPFRDAHHITGRAVAVAEKQGLDLSELDLASLQAIDSRIEADITEVLKLTSSMNARKSEGGTAVIAVEKQIEFFDKWLASELGL